MSKRYGRTQKRKHREEIARLNKSVQIRQAQIWHISKKKDQIENKYADLTKRIQMAFRNSSFIEPETINMEYHNPNIRLFDRSNLPPCVEQIDNSLKITGFRFHQTILEKIDVLARTAPVRDAKHIFVTTPHGEIGYYISRKAVEMMHHQELSHYILKQIMHILSNPPKKKQQKGA